MKTTKTYNLKHLCHDNLFRIHPIPIVVEEDENNVIVRWLEAGLTASSYNTFDAIFNFKKLIVDTILNLAKNRSNLGEKDAYVLRVMEHYIKIGV